MEPFGFEGYGSIFDGANNTGIITNISTQAVLELFRNANTDETNRINDSNFVEIDLQDVEEFNIGRDLLVVPDLNKASGIIIVFKINVCLFLDCFVHAN